MQSFQAECEQLKEDQKRNTEEIECLQTALDHLRPP